MTGDVAEILAEVVVTCRTISKSDSFGKLKVGFNVFKLVETAAQCGRRSILILKLMIEKNIWKILLIYLWQKMRTNFLQDFYLLFICDLCRTLIETIENVFWVGRFWILATFVIPHTMAIGGGTNAEIDKFLSVMKITLISFTLLQIEGRKIR